VRALSCEPDDEEEADERDRHGTAGPRDQQSACTSLSLGRPVALVIG
jgi:hypothetical protein